MSNTDKLAEFTAWCQKNITGDEKGQAQIFLDRLFQAFGQPGCLDVGGTAEFRVRKSHEDGGGTAFVNYVWKEAHMALGISRDAHYQTLCEMADLLEGEPDTASSCGV